MMNKKENIIMKREGGEDKKGKCDCSPAWKPRVWNENLRRQGDGGCSYPWTADEAGKTLLNKLSEVQ